jgi:hypothetical protein
VTRKINGPFTFTRASSISSSELYLAASPDGDDTGYPFTRIARFGAGGWTFADLDFWVVDLTLGGDGESLLGLGERGAVFRWQGDGSAQILSAISVESTPRNRLGYVLAIQKIGRNYFVVGDGGQNYTSGDLIIWSPFDISIFDGPAEAEPNIFDLEIEQYMKQLAANTSLTLNSIVGSSESDIYACGGKGNIERGLLHLDRARFTSLFRPAADPEEYTSSLSKLLVESTDRIWACGQQGALMVGNARDGFVDDPAAAGYDTIFYDMAMFDGKLHIAGLQDIYRHDGNVLTPLRIGVERKDRGAHTIESVDGVLWAVSPKDILRYDGSVWERIPYPGND